MTANHIMINCRGDLLPLRDMRDLDAVTIETARIKHRGLLPLAVRYALWAVRCGGTITIVDNGPFMVAAPAFEVPFSAVRMIVSRFLGADTKLLSFDKAGRIVVERVTPVLEPGWSAGIVFSGADKEIPVLLNALAGLADQPELSAARGGEIWVCGPARDLAFLDGMPDVRYLPFENADDGRVHASAKKNALMRAMQGPRMAVMHARIRLDPGCLAAAPREFDLLSPNTQIDDGGLRQPYLSLVQNDAMWPGVMPRRTGKNLRSVGGDPLRLHEGGAVFVDGGGFFVTKPLHRRCPMENVVAWEENEDLEWCARAFLNGYVSDIALGCTALSVTSKLSPTPKFGPLAGSIMRTVRAMRWARAAGRHAMARLRGQR